MDRDRTPRATPATLDNAEAQAERRIQSHGSPIATRTLNNASGHHANGPADNSQGAKNLPNAPPVPPKALILPAEWEKSPSDSWGQQQESYTRESGCRSPRRNPSSTSRSGWESNLYTPSHRTTFRRMSRDIAPGIDALVPVIQGRNVSMLFIYLTTRIYLFPRGLLQSGSACKIPSLMLRRRGISLPRKVRVFTLSQSVRRLKRYMHLFIS